MSGWRSISSLRPPRTMPWSSAIRILMSLPWSVRWWCPRRARRRCSRRPPTSSARSRMPEQRRGGRARPLRVGRASKPRPSSRTRSTVRPTKRQLDVDALAPRVLGDVGQALLRDAVDHELLLVGQRAAASPWRWKVARMPVRSPKSETCEASAGDEAVVVERGRAQLAGERAAAPPSPAWRAAGSPAARRAGRAARRRSSACRRSRIAVSAWLTSSWRSWAIRERSCSWARMTARPASRALLPRAGRACG